MELSRRWVVQDRESQRFLAIDGGAVAFTPWIKEAGHFLEEDAALETALLECTEGFTIFQFWILERN
ncbi:hypothetical protein VVD49_13465 [Uliginosibacterium sp. H3]|uniref:Uncharacterized protein n=1 Tax=Uliginosibacterium silvisoli TaxID=3114758 RepID=A0ABU6K5I5_9RHOO|nr:hypothetical protein [Uliginosibacterium sp. H3]